MSSKKQSRRTLLVVRGHTVMRWGLKLEVSCYPAIRNEKMKSCVDSVDIKSAD